MDQQSIPAYKSTKFMQFFWKAAGGDQSLLEMSTYSDRVKYMCLGGIVISTGAMAGLAGGYAFYTIFDKRGSAIDYTTNWSTLFMALAFGIIWGLIIFNIDRFIVTSTGKGDGTENITKVELKGAIPRILMGAIIAITISKPVEIRMFKTEIDIKLHERQLEQQSAYKAKIDSIYTSEINAVTKEINKFDAKLADKIKRHAEIEKNYYEEVRIITKGPRANALEVLMNGVAKEIELANKDPELISLKNRKDTLEVERDRELQSSQKVANGLDGLLERIKISHEVAGFWISLFITLLFMAIELTPVFFKMMLTKTTYDYLVENRDEILKAKYGIEERYDFYKEKEGLERNLIINHESEKIIYEKILLTKTQKELSDYAIEQYKIREKKRIDENLDDYIETLNKDDQTS